MLFKQRFWPGIQDGSITLTFRAWKRAQAKVGGRYHTPVGQLLVTSVSTVPVDTITNADARRAGQPLSELFSHLDRKPGEKVWRIEFEFIGADPRIALRDTADLSADELGDVLVRLARFDRASKRGPWTADTLRVIEARPGVRAADLAAACGMDTPPFKIDVRKLKALGLTESLEVGYRLSPRGRTILTALAGPGG